MGHLSPLDRGRHTEETTALAARAQHSSATLASVSVVIPVFNAIRFLPEMVPALLAAVEHLGTAEVIFVDNGSTDGSYEYLRSLSAAACKVLRLENATVAAVRNHGAAAATGAYLSFLDADCVVAPGYFRNALDVLERTGAAATGCEVRVPTPAHWIESTWHQLHYVGRSRVVHYINSANFFISSDVYRRIGGFREDLLTGEDAEIGNRINEAGHTIFEATHVAAVHLGNPKSIRQFYRRAVWHALGMLATTGRYKIDKPTAMTAVHLLVNLVGALAVASGSFRFASAVLLLLGLQLLVPITTVAFRQLQTRRIGRLPQSVLLYWLYYWARLQAVFLVSIRLDTHYRK